MIHNLTLNDYGEVFHSSATYIVLFITFVIIIGIGWAFSCFYFYWPNKKNTSAEYINFAAFLQKCCITVQRTF